ncbi:thermonuclease family protein [Streptosporangium lutulentum]|uniref:Micrococcal nuclease n=1 Tax=Streptosporangium lutulentum TaxID=1461250 RepID=A0ABT9Q9D6_9ACTN|nr:thermonuclease family protein [Streptosporangium lutulentum]MDP9843362.1 micrococcal nuclease [Streptosporangium lutulentum]
MKRSANVSLLALALAAPLIMAAPVEAAAVPKGTKKATVVKIVDGDTIDVRFTRAGPVIRVQLLEVDTPERGKCWFNTATKRTAALLPVGKATYLLADKDPRDRYGRFLYYAWNAGSVFVNRNLVRYGYGKAVLYKTNDKYIKVLRAEQVKAQRERLRIWSGKCDVTSTSTPRPVASPAPSPDPPSGENDPRFPTCGAANDAGYGPYRRGVDSEYDWYEDRDRDGIVCER